VELDIRDGVGLQGSGEVAVEIFLGTDDGVWELREGGFARRGLAGVRVTHVARRGREALAAVPRDGLYLVGAAGERRVWAGDARSCAFGPDGALYVGAEPAMIHRSDDSGSTWERSEAIDELPTRRTWTFPPPPHEPHVLSIDFLPEERESVLAGVEVGGVILSRDRGWSWRELNKDLYVDVHSARADPSCPGLLMAVTGKGFYASENGGESWARRMRGLGLGYTVGMAIRPDRAREVLVAAGDRPPGLDARVYHSLDAGASWVEIQHPSLPKVTPRASVPFFADGSAWIATDTGLVLRADDPRSSWTLAFSLPTRINAAAGEGSPSSVMH
jgi:photosystem II stability/assembly factor-like uncharacterized protein